jgi:drug/metabolite transporter (DMT)-like permease
MVGATALFVIMNTSGKLLSAHMSPVEIVWARCLGHSVFIAAIFAPRHGGWRLFVTGAPLAQLSRSLLLITSTTFFFTAIGQVPLADATTVSFMAPLIVAALAPATLGERVSAAQWGAVAAGFLGALLVVRPTAGGFNPYLLLVFGSAGCYAVYQLLTRHVAGIDPPETSVAYSALVGTLLFSVIVPFWWTTPTRLWQAVLLGGLGLLGGVGHYFVARAFALGPASIISPFHYVQLVWAALLGYAIFGDVPGVSTWLGAALIIASGLFIALRETGRRS